jgi:hypothetical protein
MRRENWRIHFLGVLVCGAVLFGLADSSASGDGFYVIPVGNANIKMVEENTAVGKGALSSNTTGERNTALGYHALHINESGSSNTAVGVGALESNFSGISNTAIGSGTLKISRTAAYNTAIGAGALIYNLGGNYNTASGAYALWANTYGDENTANGANALYLNTEGDNNTASGYHALYSNIEGDDNTANGANALFSNTTGNRNTANGNDALRSNTTGFDNMASGDSALSDNTQGSYNTADGNMALQSNTSGDANTACGTWALGTNITGSYNTAIGFSAGSGVPNFTGSDNIYIGSQVIPASANESDTIRIGSGQTRAYIQGIHGTSVSGAAVYVSSSGKLGTDTSSIRFKEDIQDMGDASSGLMRLRPVTFYHKPEYVEGPRTLQYGLIAEEVVQVYPDLVRHDPKTGEPQTVYYHLVNAMLLNEVQKQHRQIRKQNQQIMQQDEELSALNNSVLKQNEELAALKEQQRLSAEQNKELLTRLAQLEGKFNRSAEGGATLVLDQGRLWKPGASSDDPRQ